jgi:hypothetical protein
MKKFSLHLFLSAVGLAAALNIGCSSGKGDGGGTGIALTPSTDGFFDGTNEAGILGAWYSYGDWYGGTPATGGMGDCKVKGGFDQAVCSVIETPIPGEKFTNTGKMCTKGTAAVVIKDATMAFAYSAIWGAGIGFDLNNAGTDDGGTGAKGAWDATAHNVVGFSFTIDTPPTGGQMRVEFPTNAIPGTTDINSAYWGGATMGLSPFNKGGDYSFMFDDVPAGNGVGGPMYLTGATPFDRTKIQSMQFHVVTNTSSAIPFEYCISNLKALTK